MKQLTLLSFLEPGPTINSDCYPVTLTKLEARTSGVKLEKITNFYLQHRNAGPHISLKTIEHTVKLGCTVLAHSL